MRRGRRRAAEAKVGVAILAAWLGACAGGSAEPRPVASLGSSPSSDAAFDAVRQAWRAQEKTHPRALESALEEFLARYPDDGRVPFVRVLLALVAMERGDLPAADRQLARLADLPPGSVHDLATVARARRLRMRGDAEGALDLLRPLVGKTVEPIARTAFEEELTLAALATHREYEAISYMDAWLRASSEDEKERTVSLVRGFVAKLPQEVLLGALQALRAQRASYGYGVDIERILATRLVDIATASGNAQLARTLLDPDAGMVVVEGAAGAELGELATSRRGLNSVEGRTLGLLLPTDSPALREESAAVLRGVMWALGLPPGVRAAPGPAVVDGGAGARVEAGYACAPAEAGPPLSEPSPEEGVHLVTRDDAGSSDRTEVSLDELAGEGAALVVAGLDAVASKRAIRWGNEHGVAVIALTPPEPGGVLGAFGFVLGAEKQASIDALVRAAPGLLGPPVATLVDESELGSSAAPPPGMRLLPPVSCDAPVLRAGDPRFPLGSWRAEGARGWLVSGSPECARALVSELETAQAPLSEKPVVALTLEAAALVPHPPGVRVVTAATGLVPSLAAQSSDEEVRRFAAALGDASVTYWTALGRDAATLARAALRRIPLGSVTEPRGVSGRRSQARDELAAARVRLWSSESTGWSATSPGEGGERRGVGHVLARTVCALQVPLR